ncbi:glycosyltransferase family 9 protein [Geopsychrobacter electrodiphilus]|uniref:glycosyltransferase family 9 protein n=1 Tax=Geopsychrobacter electrodiphilus TaxID=225196 RepID=UPI00036DD37C|nr:glycosyltransferase family 9 protein [Geopsychrobacter electrodiphilus]
MAEVQRISKPIIALIPSRGMGDGLLQLQWARIFQDNGYRVICYQNFLAQLGPLLDGIEVRPLQQIYSPEADAQPGVVWFDVGSDFEPAKTEFSSSLLHFPYCLSRSWQPPTDIRSSYSGDDPLLQSMRQAPYNVYNRKKKSLIVEDIRWFCRNFLNLDVDSPQGSPIKAAFRQAPGFDPRRVLIHPSSSNPIKNWHLSGFVALADRLKARGWHPVFTFSPAEEAEVVPALQGRHEWLLTSSIAELAEGYRGACALIGNDSGNGHLASSLGLPVLTILNAMKLNYRWRPCWTPSRLISGWVPFKFSQRYWHYSLSVQKVVRAFEGLMADPARYSTHVDHVNLDRDNI